MVTQLVVDERQEVGGGLPAIGVGGVDLGGSEGHERRV
jgi:hypothetical protein